MPCFYGWTLSRTVQAVCTVPPHSKWSNLWRSPNLWRPPEISLISVKPQQSISLLTGALSKSGEHTNDHHHCPMSVFLLTTSKLQANREILRCNLCSIYMRGGGGERGRGEVANHVTALIWL